MPVRFNSAPPRDWFDVIQFKVGVKWHLVVASDKSYRKETPLHWLPAAGRTVPCLHEDCPWHHLPERRCIYLPAATWSQETQRWQNLVLPVMDGMRKFLEKDCHGRIWTFERRDHEKAPVSFWLSETQRGAFPFPGFDVEPSLLRMWGQYVNYKLIRNSDAGDVAADLSGKAVNHAQ
jgi:hypothetical protein